LIKRGVGADGRDGDHGKVWGQGRHVISAAKKVDRPMASV